MNTPHDKTQNMEKESIFLGLGSNMGDRREYLIQALKKLQKYVSIEKISSIYETEPVGYKEQDMFLNMVCQGKTSYPAQEMLHKAKTIETEMGREHTFRNGPRPIDIDILLYGSLVIKQEKLTVPHPRMAERAFVLIPLNEIAPDILDPATNRTIRQLSQNISSGGISRYDPTKQITLAEIE